MIYVYHQPRWHHLVSGHTCKQKHTKSERHIQLDPRQNLLVSGIKQDLYTFLDCQLCLVTTDYRILC